MFEVFMALGFGLAVFSQLLPENRPEQRKPQRQLPDRVSSGQRSDPPEGVVLARQCRRVQVRHPADQPRRVTVPR